MWCQDRWAVIVLDKLQAVATANAVAHSLQDVNRCRRCISAMDTVASRLQTRRRETVHAAVLAGGQWLAAGLAVDDDLVDKLCAQGFAVGPTPTPCSSDALRAIAETPGLLSTDAANAIAALLASSHDDVVTSTVTAWAQRMVAAATDLLRRNCETWSSIVFHKILEVCQLSASACVPPRGFELPCTCVCVCVLCMRMCAVYVYLYAYVCCVCVCVLCMCMCMRMCAVYVYLCLCVPAAVAVQLLKACRVLGSRRLSKRG